MPDARGVCLPDSVEFELDGLQYVGVARHPDDLRTGREPQVLDLLEQLVKGDLDLQPRQVGSDAPVHAEAERGVAAARLVEDQRVRVVEPGLVSVGLQRL